MVRTQTALYRASVLADNLGVRLCLAAVMVMPSALVFLFPLLGVLSASSDAPLTVAPVADTWAQAFLAVALGLGFTGAWMRIVFAGHRLLRRAGPRRFVVGSLALGVVTLVVELALRLGTPSGDAAWPVLAALASHSFLLGATLGQARPERLNRI